MAEKKIISRQHLDAFLHSQTYRDVVDLLEALNEQAVGVTLRQDSYESEVCQLTGTAYATLYTNCTLRADDQGSPRDIGPGRTAGPRHPACRQCQIEIRQSCIPDFL